MSPLPIPGPASSPVSQIPHLACVPPPGPQESSCSLDCLCSQQSLPSGGNKMTERLFPAPQGFPGGSEGKESACNAGDLGLIPGLGRCPGEGKGCPLHYSCLENSMDRGAWWATVRGVEESDTTERLSPSLSCPASRSLFIYDWPGWLLRGLHSRVREEDAV